MNIWQSIECDAWSRGFKYDDYLNIHTQFGEEGAVISFDMYEALCELFDIEYEDSFK